MARVHLIPIESNSPLTDPASPEKVAARLRESARLDRLGVHTLTDDPVAADLILFIRSLTEGAIFFRLLRHPLVRRFRRKCYLYDPNDRIVPVLPGIFPSVERSWYSRGRTRSGPYLLADENPFLNEDHADAERIYLYSFLGSYTSAPIRGQFDHLDHPRGYCRDTYEESQRVWRHGTAQDGLDFRRRYLEATWASDFVLCPRGHGVSSMRLFETMCAGRSPVILSDDWVPPDGPCWERFSIRIREADLMSLPAVLAARRHEAAAMGVIARQQWEEWYSPPVLFHRMVEDCLSIGQARRWPEPLAAWTAYPQMLRPTHQQHWARQTGLAARIKDLVRLQALRRRHP